LLLKGSENRLFPKMIKARSGCAIDARPQRSYYYFARFK
jgi:hypothetical protein